MSEKHPRSSSRRRVYGIAGPATTLVIVGAALGVAQNSGYWALTVIGFLYAFVGVIGFLFRKSKPALRSNRAHRGDHDYGSLAQMIRWVGGPKRGTSTTEPSRPRLPKSDRRE